MELMKSYLWMLPLLMAAVGAAVAFFIPSRDLDSDERPLGVIVVSITGVAAAIVAHAVALPEAKIMLAAIFAAGAACAYISATSAAASFSLLSAAAAASTWLMKGDVVSIMALPSAAFFSSLAIDARFIKRHLGAAAIASVMFIFGAAALKTQGFIVCAAAIAWFGFFLPFSAPSPDETGLNSIILRAVILPVAAMPFVLAHKEMTSLLSIIAGASLLFSAAKSYQNSVNPLVPLASASCAAMILGGASPHALLAHMAAVSGAALTLGERGAGMFVRKLFLFSLAGAPFLGGFWSRWETIKKIFLVESYVIPFIIIINSAVWMLALIIGGQHYAKVRIIPSYLITAAIAVAVAAVLFFGVVGY